MTFFSKQTAENNIWFLHTFTFSFSIIILGIADLFSGYTTVHIDKKYHKTMYEERKMYTCTCSDCGKESKVPFDPTPGKPVYCKECLPKHQSRRF